jgi:hypothetical protein
LRAGAVEEPALRFVGGQSYNRDFHGEDREGRQWPMMNVFRKTDRIRHTWGSES